jgi:hypothetical protein
MDQYTTYHGEIDIGKGNWLSNKELETCYPIIFNSESYLTFHITCCNEIEIYLKLLY